MTTVWVIARNDGEGHSPPLQVFETEDIARAAIAVAVATNGCRMELFEVPVWPTPIGSPWPVPATAKKVPA